MDSVMGTTHHEPSDMGATMGQPVVHFEIVSRNGEALREYYAKLFGWEYDLNNPMKYGIVSREDNSTPEGVGIGGGIMEVPEGYAGHLTFYVAVPDVEAALAQAESLGGTRMMGPDEVMPGLTVGLFTDPEGHTVGVLTGTSA